MKNIKNLKNAMVNKFETLKEEHVESKPIRLMIKSWQNYDDHRINILKECLTMWSEPNAKFHGPFNFRTCFIDHNTDDAVYHVPFNDSHNKRIFFLNTTMKELKQYKLEFMLDIPDVNAASYMDANTSDIVYFVNREISK